MNPDHFPLDDRPPAPLPRARAGRRGAVALALALLVLVGVAYRAYHWLASDVERRRAVAEAPAATPAATPTATPGPQRPGLPRPDIGDEGPAPAVTGQGVRQCVVDGRVTYTNLPCPETAARAPRQVAAGELPVAADASQQAAVCAYLQAEIERLDFEFRQPLPPPVLDLISSRLSGLRTSHGTSGCHPLPRATDGKATAAQRPPARVMQEKRAN